MILLDKPFVSDFLKQTIVDEQLALLRTKGLEKFDLPDEANIWEEDAALAKFEREGPGYIYSNSENALGWMTIKLGFSELPEKINMFKDKTRFRELLQPDYPRFFFQEVSLQALAGIDFASLPAPVVVKPAVGFFSMGVHKAADVSEWQSALAAIHAEMKLVQTLYPVEVLDTTRFIIESCVEGDEFAIDAYYDDEGKVVLLNILHHMFSSAEDVSDRVYITSRKIIDSYSSGFIQFLSNIGQLAGLRRFPVHAEVRIDAQGQIVPIEVNPMRFAGWCTTDVAYHAYGFNPYLCYLNQESPNWEQIVSEEDDHLYTIIVLDKPGDVDVRSIASFHYEAVRGQFENVLEMRKIDYEEYPVFGFLFTKTRPENLVELERILRSDLKEFISF